MFGAFEKMVKPYSYNVAADAYVEMCPPMPGLFVFADTTIAIAFQRIIDLIFLSVSLSPLKGAS